MKNVLKIILFFGLAAKSHSQSNSSFQAGDTVVVNQFLEKALRVQDRNLDSSLLLSAQALKLSAKLEWPRGQALSYQYLGKFSVLKGDYVSALDHYLNELQSLDLLAGSKSISEVQFYKKHCSVVFRNIAVVYFDQGNYETALLNYFKALANTEPVVFKKDYARILGKIGSTYLALAKSDSALHYLTIAAKLETELKNEEAVAEIVTNEGNAYYVKKDYVNALKYYSEALNMQEKRGDVYGMAFSFGNLAAVYKAKKDYSESEKNYKKSIRLFTETGDMNGVAIQSSGLGEVYLDLKRYPQAENFFLRANTLSDSTGDLYGKQESCQNLYKLFAEKGDFKTAYVWYEKFTAVKDTLNNEEKNASLLRQSMNFEFDRKIAAAEAEQEKKDALAKTESKKRVIFLSVIGIVLLLTIIFSVFIFMNLVAARRQKLEIEEKNRINEAQKKLIEEKNRDILGSLTYARRIQSSLLPTEVYLKRIFSSR